MCQHHRRKPEGSETLEIIPTSHVEQRMLPCITRAISQSQPFLQKKSCFVLWIYDQITKVTLDIFFFNLFRILPFKNHETPRITKMV